MTLRFTALAVCAALTLGCASAPAKPQASRRSPLVVVLVVDQMRTDYLENLRPAFTGGLRRLVDEGAWFTEAAYPYLNTVTCAGHATIATGALPYRHGMVLNAWWDREQQRSRPCTDDRSVKNIAYAGGGTGGDSADALLLEPLAEQLRENTGGRVVALSLKPRSAITMAGRNPTAVVWFDDRNGWTTSTASTKAPVKWLQDFFTANPITADQGKKWERLLAPSSYAGPDEDPAERAPTGWTRSFAHPIGQPPAQFNTQWQRSPFADEYLGRLAAHAVDTLDLGRGSGTDFLSVSFSTLDLIGHGFGPRSHEVQDVVLRLDRTIGALLAHLDARLGRDGYVLALTADHGVAELPEHTGAGRQPSSAVIAAIDTALAPFFGAGKYVAHTVYTDIYLAPGVLDRLRNNAKASAAVLDALRALPGVAHAFRSDEIDDASDRRSADPVKRAAALSHYKPRSGDLVIVPRENWLLSTAATTHGTLYPYDRKVPVIFFGAGVQPGRHASGATPADIAPTLAQLAGARFSRTDGAPLIPSR